MEGAARRSISTAGFDNVDLFSTAQWQFAQFGNLVFATQANAVLQVFDLSSATAFADCAGSPPQAAYISVVGRFLVLSGLLSNPYRIQWSGLNATTTWTSGHQQFGLSGLPGRRHCSRRGGRRIRDRVSGSGDPAHVLCSGFADHLPDRPHHAGQGAVRALFDHPGGRENFLLCRAGLSQDRARRRARADRARKGRPHVSLADLDKGNLQLFMGAADPRSTRVYWAYKSVAARPALTTRCWATTSCWIGSFRSSARANTCSAFRKPG
jgi:hypothetical protein